MARPLPPPPSHLSAYARPQPLSISRFHESAFHKAWDKERSERKLACITEEGLLLPLNKKKKADPQRYQLISWSDELRAVIARVLELRAKVRCGQKDVKDLDTAPLFLNRKGKAWTKTGFNSQWHRATRAAGFKKNEFHFHDIKAKSVSDSPNESDAQNRGGHLDPRTTRRVYRRKPVEVIPLPQVSKKIS